MSSFDIKLDRPERIYGVGEVVSGCVLIKIDQGSLRHRGLHLISLGRIAFRAEKTDAEAPKETTKTVDILSFEGVLMDGGMLDGETTIPFEFPTRPLEGTELYESYRGVLVSVSYYITAKLYVMGEANPIVQRIDFAIEVPQTTSLPMNPVDFTLSSDKLEPSTSTTPMPAFDISGRLDSTNCNLIEPMTGYVTVNKCTDPIQSVELQLVRHERIGTREERSEVQNIQLALDDVARGLPIPIYMMFPRRFCAPSAKTNLFKIGFEVVVVVLLSDNRMLTERIPIKTFRTTVGEE